MSRCEGGANFREANRSQRCNRQENSQQEARVANAVDDERLLSRIRGGFSLKIKTNQKIAAQAHTFPADEQQQHIVRQDQREHREHEQVHVAEETVVTAFVAHVPDRIHVNQEADTGDDQRHHRRKRIEEETPIGDKINEPAGTGVHQPRRNPREKDFLDDAVSRIKRRQLPDGACGVNQRHEHAADADCADHGVRKLAAN